MSREEHSPPRGVAVPATVFALVALAVSVGGYLGGQHLQKLRMGSAVAVAPPAATPGSALQASAHGEELFGANCAGCHGAQAQGGVGPKLAGLVGSWKPADFAHAVLDGVAPDGRTLAPMMPRFKQTGLGGAPPTDADIEAIHTFVAGL